jgi:hypothetical protein
MPGHVLHLSNPLLPLPFPAPPLLVTFCARPAFHHSLSCPTSHFPPRLTNAFLAALCPFGHFCCLGTGFECLPLVHLPFWRHRWNRKILYFLKCPKALQSNILKQSYCISCAPSKNSSRAHTDNRINLVPELHSCDLGSFRVALSFCYPEGIGTM